MLRARLDFGQRERACRIGPTRGASHTRTHTRSARSRASRCLRRPALRQRPRCLRSRRRCHRFLRLPRPRCRPCPRPRLPRSRRPHRRLRLPRRPRILRHHRRPPRPSCRHFLRPRHHCRRTRYCRRRRTKARTHPDRAARHRCSRRQRLLRSRSPHKTSLDSSRSAARCRHCPHCPSFRPCRPCRRRSLPSNRARATNPRRARFRAASARA